MDSREALDKLYAETGMTVDEMSAFLDKKIKESSIGQLDISDSLLNNLIKESKEKSS